MHGGASTVWKVPGELQVQDTPLLKEGAPAYEPELLAWKGSTAGVFSPPAPNTPSSSLQVCGVLGLAE